MIGGRPGSAEVSRGLSRFSWILLVAAILLMALSRVLYHLIFRGTKDWWGW
jgi:hypothetical protein